MFANILTADDKYSCRNMQNFLQQLETLWSEKRKTFFGYFLHFWYVHEIYNILKKRMSVLALLYPKLFFPKEVATETSRRSCFRTPFGNQRVNVFQKPLKEARHHYYPFFLWISGKLSLKKTALFWSKILRLFLTHILPTTSIHAAICRILGNNFKRYYLKNGRLFLDFFCISEMCMKFKTFLKQGWMS